jgi:hypothetical protein
VVSAIAVTSERSRGRLRSCDAEQVAHAWLRSGAVEYPGFVRRPLVGSAVDATREHPANNLAAVNVKQKLVGLCRSPEHEAHVGRKVISALTRATADFAAIYAD